MAVPNSVLPGVVIAVSPHASVDALARSEEWCRKEKGDVSII